MTEVEGFFKVLVSSLLLNQAIDPQQLGRALNYIRIPSYRRIFVFQLSQERAIREVNELQNAQFMILSILFKAALDVMLVDGRSIDGKSFDKHTLLLINMALTYYRVIGKTKQYISTSISSHPIFREFEFWQLAFRIESKQKIAELKAIQSMADEETDQIEDISGYRELQRMTRLATLQFFSVAMRDFGRGREDFVKFVDWHNEALQLKLTSLERSEILQSYQDQQATKNSESLEQKRQRLDLEAAILHDFRVAASSQSLSPQEICKQTLARLYAGDDVAQPVFFEGVGPSRAQTPVVGWKSSTGRVPKVPADYRPQFV